MRRLVAWITATAAAGVAASVAMTMTTSTRTQGPTGRLEVSRGHRTLVPRFYLETDLNSAKARFTETALRAVSTGAIMARIRCPGSKPEVNASAAADNQTFFVSCSMASRLGTRIYRFAVGPAGRVGRLTPVPGGTLSRLRTGNLASTADGSELAIDAAPPGPGRISAIIVINTKTGAHAVWHSALLGGGVGFIAMDLSFTEGGRELAAFGYTRCVTGAPGRRCKSPGEVVVAVHSPARGGRLSSGRTIFTQAQVVQPRAGWLNDAFISPDGASVVTAVNGPGGATVYRVPTNASNPPMLLYQLDSPGGSSYRLISPDPSGRFLLFTAIAGRFQPQGVKEVNGWISPATLTPLKPSRLVFREVW